MDCRFDQCSAHVAKLRGQKIISGNTLMRYRKLRIAWTVGCGIVAKAALIAVLASAVLTASYLLPFNPLLLSFIPLTELFPSLAQTGPAVEYGFAWLVIKEQWVWVVIGVYHFVIVFVAAFLAMALRDKGRFVDD
jgi:hypothetical protein